MTRILTRTDVALVLSLDDCIAAVEGAFRDFGEGRVAPPRSLAIPSGSGVVHIKAAVADVFAAKINANYPLNPRQHGLPMIQGVIVLMDAGRGTLLALLDSTLITTLRTAAATAVAAKYLARAGATTATIIGCGNQGRAHLEALLRVREISKAFAHDADPEVAAGFAREMEHQLGIQVRPSSSIDDAVAASDIVICCTPARSPILDQHHLHDGIFIAGVGADNPDKSELSPALLGRCKVVPDFLEQAVVMGDLHHALEAGLLTEKDIHGELADVVCGRVTGRKTSAEMFVFDSTGTALQDVAAASVAFTRAIEQGVGLDVAFC